MTRVLHNIIFDLDGTLIDSNPVLVNILNTMLAERGSPRRITLADIRPLSSLGGPGLVGGVLAKECGDLQQEVDDFRARYSAMRTPMETLYPGVAEGLRTLSAQGYRLAICSNKPQHLCEKVLAETGLDHLFAAIVGSAPGRLAKPAPDLMELVLERLGASRHDCLYVGDNAIDQALAQATGVRFAFVSYGYAHEPVITAPSATFSRFSDLVGSVIAEPVSLLTREAA